MKDFILPDIGEGIVECELLKWLVAEGDIIKEDQPVAEVMTDKATVEIPAMHNGMVTKLYYKEGDIVDGKVTGIVDFGAFVWLRRSFVDVEFDGESGQITAQYPRKNCWYAISATEEVEEEGEIYDSPVGGIAGSFGDDGARLRLEAA